MKAKTVSRVLLYASFIYLFYYLYKKGLVQIPENIDYTVLCFSGLALVAAFVVHGLVFKALAKKYDVFIRGVDSLIVFGMFIITRYLPGKIWIFIGPATYLNDKYGYPLDKLLTISLTSQFLNLWVGLAICSVAVIVLPSPLILSILCIVAWLVLSLVLFTQYTHRVVSLFLSKTMKRKIDIPWVSFKKSMSVLPIYGIIWIFYSFAFLLLGLSVGIKPSAVLFFSFPLATIIGMVAVFVPGGLGVREGVLVYILTLGGVAIVEATTLSAFSRLWFLVGEILLFVIGISLNLMYKKNKQNTVVV